MTAFEVVAYKTSRIQRRLQRICAGLDVDRDIFLRDMGRIEQVAFNIFLAIQESVDLFLAIQESVDLASHMVSEEGWGTPATLAETFDLLALHDVLSSETAEQMRQGTRLRNLIAHAYADIDPSKLFDAASAGVSQIERFLAEVARWVTKPPS